MASLLPDAPYFPRPDLLARVLRVYASGLRQAVTLFAPRRQGKTWFVLHELLPAAEETGWQPVYIDLWRMRSDPARGLVHALEREAGEGSKSWLKKLKVKAKVPLGPAGLDVELRGDQQASPNRDLPLEERLEAALDTLVARANVTLLVIDEFQALAIDKSEHFVAAFRTVLQKHKGRLLVFYTGSSREALNRMFRQVKAPLFRSAQALQLPDLGVDFVVDRAELLQERTGLGVDREALAEAFERLGNSPEFLNWLIVDMMVRGDADVESSMREWMEQQRVEHFDELLTRLKQHDLGVLLFLSIPNSPSIYSADGLRTIAELSTAESTVTASKVQASLNRLRKMGLVAPTGETGGYEIEDRSLTVWLREYVLQAEGERLE